MNEDFLVTEFKGEKILLIPINFHKDGAFLSVKTFNDSASSLEKIIHEMFDKIFESENVPKVYIFAPEDGSFREWLGISFMLGALSAFLQTDIGVSFVEGLTEREPAYWAEQVGATIRHGVLEMVEDEEQQNEEQNDESSDQNLQELQYRFDSIIIFESLKEFLTTNISNLGIVDTRTKHYNNLFKAKNQFLDTCMGIDTLEGISFGTNWEKFTDTTNLRHAKEEIYEEERVKESYKLAHEILHVTSPNWDKDDDKRLWKAKDDNGVECYFKILDGNFWAYVREAKIDIQIIDNMEVQWAFVDASKSKSKGLVTKLIKYNGQKIGNPLSEDDFKNKVLMDIIKYRGQEDIEVDLGESHGKKRLVAYKEPELPLFHYIDDE